MIPIGNLLKIPAAVHFVEMESYKAVKSVMTAEITAINDIVMQHVMDKHHHSRVIMSLMSLQENVKRLLHFIIVQMALAGATTRTGLATEITLRLRFVIGMASIVMLDMYIILI
jgi:hypothetical protein